MAYGTPESLAEVEPYYTHIRGGRPPAPEAVARLQKRYEVVGGRTPLLAITSEVSEKLEAVLNASSGDRKYRVYFGMKHWHPFIGDVIPVAERDGVSSLVAVALAPHYSRMSIGGYRSALDNAIAKLSRPLDVTFVENWHLHPEFIQLIAARVRNSLTKWPAETRDQVKLVFSAHSLPVKIREWNDPYEEQLLESCRAVSELAGHSNWCFAWQSAGHTGEPWLGPDILDVLERLNHEKVRDVLSVPIGFVSDHLEIQYDLDYQAANKAKEMGMTFVRTEMPNTDPAFVKLLASVVTQAGK